MSGQEPATSSLLTPPLHSLSSPRLQSAAMKPQQCDQLGGQGATGAARSERRLQVRGRERYGVTRAAVGGAVGSGKAESRE